MEPENPGKTRRYQYIISDAMRRTKLVRTKLVPEPADTTIGTIKVLCGEEKGGGGRKRSKNGQESSCTEDARRENLEEIRRRRVRPEDAVNGQWKPFTTGVWFKPTLLPPTRAPR